MTRLTLISIALLAVSCPPGPPSPPVPTPTAPATVLPSSTPPVAEQCAATGKFFDCWDLPPGSPSWVYVHKCDSCPGGVCTSGGPTVPCAGAPTPPAGSCAKFVGSTPCEGVRNEPVGTIEITLFGGNVDAALAKVTACEVGSDCGPGPSGDAQKRTTLAVMRELGAKGFCPTYDLDGGNAGLNSEMGVRRDAKVIEWYQILSSAGKVRWSLPGGVRGRCAPPTDEETIEEVALRWALAPPSPPQASPSPPTASPPAGWSCSFGSSDVSEWRTQVHPVAGTQTIDSTPMACNFDDPPRPPCDHPHGLARCCLLSEEKGNQGCADKLFGTPTWSVVAGDVRIVTPWAGTSTKVKVADGAGLIKLEGSADPRTKVCVRVIAGIPACALAADGGCTTEACP